MWNIDDMKTRRSNPSIPRELLICHMISTSLSEWRVFIRNPGTYSQVESVKTGWSWPMFPYQIYNAIPCFQIPIYTLCMIVAQYSAYIYIYMYVLHYMHIYIWYVTCLVLLFQPQSEFKVKLYSWNTWVKKQLSLFWRSLESWRHDQITIWHPIWVNFITPWVGCF